MIIPSYIVLPKFRLCIRPPVSEQLESYPIRSVFQAQLDKIGHFFKIQILDHHMKVKVFYFVYLS